MVFGDLDSMRVNYIIIDGISIDLSTQGVTFEAGYTNHSLISIVNNSCLVTDSVNMWSTGSIFMNTTFDTVGVINFRVTHFTVLVN